MGACLQVVHTFKQNITGGGAFESLAAGTGDSLAVPNFDAGSRGELLEMWGGMSANAGEFGLRSPFFHDNTRGVRVAYMFNPTLSGADGDPQLLLPSYIRQPLYRSDTLTAEVNGTATNNVALDLLEYFDNLEGSDQQLYRWEEIEGRIKNTLGIRVSVTAGATGDYGSNRLLNQDDDRLKANTDYAILGITGQLPCGLVAFTAPETSGRRIGCPIHWDDQISGGFFVDLANKYRIPAIPVINANNRGNVVFQAADAAAAVAVAATVIMAELR
jgi:hypothetical protein